MAYKEYHRYIGKLDRPDAALSTDLNETKRRKEAAAAWERNGASLPDNAFADDVVDNDDRPYRCRAVTEVYTGLSNYD